MGLEDSSGENGKSSLHFVKEKRKRSIRAARLPCTTLFHTYYAVFCFPAFSFPTSFFALLLLPNHFLRRAASFAFVLWRAGSAKRTPLVSVCSSLANSENLTSFNWSSLESIITFDFKLSPIYIPTKYASVQVEQLSVSQCDRGGALL